MEKLFIFAGGIACALALYATIRLIDRLAGGRISGGHVLSLVMIVLFFVAIN